MVRSRFRHFVIWYAQHYLVLHFMFTHDLFLKIMLRHYSFDKRICIIHISSVFFSYGFSCLVLFGKMSGRKVFSIIIQISSGSPSYCLWTLAIMTLMKLPKVLYNFFIYFRVNVSNFSCTVNVIIFYFMIFCHSQLNLHCRISMIDEFDFIT